MQRCWRLDHMTTQQCCEIQRKVFQFCAEPSHTNPRSTYFKCKARWNSWHSQQHSCRKQEKHCAAMIQLEAFSIHKLFALIYCSNTNWNHGIVAELWDIHIKFYIAILVSCSRWRYAPSSGFANRHLKEKNLNVLRWMRSVLSHACSSFCV